MSDKKRYTWTVSVIAVVDEDEIIEGDAVQVEAFRELESAITQQRYPNKGITFSIFQYDVKTRTAIIKTSSKCWGRYKLKERERISIPDFYGNDLDHLVAFFKNYVAKTSANENEEHRHLFMVWGHAAGLGFFKKKIQGLISNAISPDVADQKEWQEYVRDTVDKIEKINFIRSHFSIGGPPPSIFQPPRNEALLPEKAMDMDWSRSLMDAISESLKVITGSQLSEVIKKGLELDIFSNTRKDNSGTGSNEGKKVDIMISLACYVNMLETAYTLKDVVNIYVAPQTMISHYGYNYRKLFALMCENPACDEREISFNLVSNYLVKFAAPPLRNKVNNFTIAGLNYKDTVSFSCWRLSDIERILERLQQLKQVVVLIKEAETQLGLKVNIRAVLTDALGRCSPTTRGGSPLTGIIDYENFITEIFLKVHRVIEGLRGFFTPGLFYSGEQTLASYYPGVLAEARYDLNLKRFLSQSPGSFSIFLPGEELSELENEIRKIYFEDEGIKKFLAESGWDFIIDLTSAPAPISSKT